MRNEVESGSVKALHVLFSVLGLWTCLRLEVQFKLTTVWSDAKESQVSKMYHCIVLMNAFKKFDVHQLGKKPQPDLRCK